MKRQIQLGAFVVTFSSTMQTFAQTAASAPQPLPAASVSPTAGVPGGGITWFVAGLAVGLVVGYIIGRNSARATSPAAG